MFMIRRQEAARSRVSLSRVSKYRIKDAYRPQQTRCTASTAETIHAPYCNSRIMSSYQMYGEWRSQSCARPHDLNLWPINGITSHVTRV